MAPAVLIAAPKSGAGKTTITLGITAALRGQGMSVAALKCGPDYIDAAFHAAASGQPCFNIDSWSMSPDHMAEVLAAAADGNDLLIIEAAMGLFDGAEGGGRRSGAAADIAAIFKVPVILVVDMGGQAQSVGALVRGFAGHDPEVTIAGVVLNGVASDRHRRMAAEGIASTGIPIMGWLGRAKDIALADRHLGLVQARERHRLREEIDRIGERVSATIDLDAVINAASPIELGTAAESTPNTTVNLRPPGQRIAVANDEAFSFMYAHLDAAWGHQGAEILHFSPLADEAPPPDADSCWLPGGYPELFASTIAAAGNFIDGIVQFAQDRPVHGECGGYMVLGQSLEDAGGVTHKMTGLLGHSTSFKNRKLHLGYRRASLAGESVLGPEGAAIRGHEFHYSTVSDGTADEPLAHLTDASGQSLGPAGGRRGRVSGSFFHAISAENPAWAKPAC